MKRHRHIVVYALFFTLILAGAALAESSKSSKHAKVPDNTLKLHQHIRPFLFPSALLSTNVGVYLGYTYGQVAYEDKLDFLLFKEDTFKVGGLSETVDFEGKFNKYFSTEFLMTGQLISGVDDRTAMIFGAQGAYGVSVIPKVSLLRKEKIGTAVSLGADLSYEQGYNSSPFLLLTQLINNAVDLVNDLAEGRIDSQGELEEGFEDLVKIELEDSLTITSTTMVSPMILFTQTIATPFGIQASARYDYGVDQSTDSPNDDDSGDPPTGWFVGAMATYDFFRVSSTPLGLRLEGGYESSTDDEDESTTTNIAGGFLYTGRRNLDLGTTFSYQTSESKLGEEDISSKGTSYLLLLNMKYYF